MAVRLALSCVGDEMKWRERDRGEQGPGNQQQDEGGAGCLGVEGDLDANKVDGGGRQGSSCGPQGCRTNNVGSHRASCQPIVLLVGVVCKYIASITVLGT